MVSAAEVARGQPAKLTSRKSGEKLNKATEKAIQFHMKAGVL